MKLEIRQIAAMTGGRIFPPAARATVSGVSTDSRSIRPGDLFVPLRGPNFDGHDFLAEAVQRGASACLSQDVIAGFPVPVIGVTDTLVALGDLAAGVRRGFAGPVVAVTGSSGKTTTKDMLSAILVQTGPGVATEGNFNNLIGLPLTLCRLTPEDHWAVLEMGMSARGEIARLAEIAAPTIGVITNIGPAHLEELQTLDGVARAKGELFAALPAGGTAVINADDERVARLPVANGVNRLFYGLDPAATVHAAALAEAGTGIAFTLQLPEKSVPVRLAVPGRHNVANALAAAAAAHALGIGGADIASGLAAFRPRAGRLETVALEDGVLLIDDSYNANPLSMKAALAVLAESGGGRKLAVLGDMLELGDQAAALHREVGGAAGWVDGLVVLGTFAGELAAGAREAGLAGERIRRVRDHAEALKVLCDWLEPGTRILVKGSRGMRMEKICAALRGAQACSKAGYC
jgi:UDP-N-acetylmuramoyl-tripeptide--D-alanyl-D-alanine ligase